MPHTLVAIDPEARTGGLLVEVHPELAGSLPAALLRDLEARMFDRSFFVALAITRDQVHVIRDLMTAMEFRGNSYDVTGIAAGKLFEHIKLGPPASEPSLLLGQIREWLAAVGDGWTWALPREAVPLMVPEVVGHLPGAEISEREGLLDLKQAVA